MNDIKFERQQGGLGRALPGEDYVSGLLFFSNSYPSGFSSSQKVRQVFSVTQAESYGIVDTYSDETKATASYLVTTPGTNGDVLSLVVAEPAVSAADGSLGSNPVTIGTYTKVSGDSTAANVATAIAAAINAGTSTHGYTASVSTATVTITARPGLGKFLNAASKLTETKSSGATIAGTITDFSGGVASKLAVMHYHISEYFRMQPKGNVYVGVFPVPTTYNFAEIADIQNYANGKIRQIGIYNDAARTVTEFKNDGTAIQAVLTQQYDLHKPLVALYGANLKAVTDLSTFPDLGTGNNPEVTHVLGQDGGGLGAYLFHTTQVSITDLGAKLGAVALAKVSESIMWVEKFNFSDGIELEVLAFPNGTLYKDVPQTLLDQLDRYRYVFLRKHIGRDGSYANDSHTAVKADSDYAFIESNRTMHKAIRGGRSSYLPLLGMPIVLNADGTMSDDTVAIYEGAPAPNLDQMVRDGELSGNSEAPGYKITVDPAQNVLSTSKVFVQFELLPVGTGRNLVVKIGYVQKIS